MDRTTDARTARPTGTAGLPSTRGETSRGRLMHLDDLDDFKVADGEPDIRGWTVKSSDGRTVGKVEDLIVDCGAMKVRYMEVELDRKGLKLNEDRHVLVPIGGARLNDDDDVVVVSGRATELAGMPAYARTTITDDHERTLRDRYAPSAAAGTAGATADLYAGESFDDRKFFGKRRSGRDDAQYITRSEEELRVGKRAVEAGAVEVHKRVETEHVREQVPVMHEEAQIERRPITGDEARAAAGDVRVQDEEIRVPLMGEEVVAEKRAVPKEELVIRKRAVQDERTVEADLKRERVDVDDSATRKPRR